MLPIFITPGENIRDKFFVSRERVYKKHHSPDKNENVPYKFLNAISKFIFFT